MNWGRKSNKGPITLLKILVIVFSIALLSVALIFLNYHIRQKVFFDLKPVALKNCIMKRFGSANDGGYVMCENLLNNVQSAYSYGIGGNDDWGCDVAKQYNLTVHQYDCFDTNQPVCTGGKFIFHTECIGAKSKKKDNKIFDTLSNQILKNNDQGKRLVVKMDVDGDEWFSLLFTPETVLSNIDQLVVEFHNCNFLLVFFNPIIKKLKKTFYIANVHFNNCCCPNKFLPSPIVFEVLFVNKKIGIINEAESKPILPNPLDAPNLPEKIDCLEQAF